MSKIIAKPHLFFFGLIPIFIVIGIFNRHQPIDINISYIHYLINIDFWCYVTALFFSLIGLNYLALNWIKKHPNKILTSIHIIIQTLCLFPYLYAVFSIDKEGNLMTGHFLGITNLQSVLIFSFIAFLFSILIHLVNFFVSVFIKTE